MYSRRTFLASLAALAAARWSRVGNLGNLGALLEPASRKLQRIGLQLYTVRGEMKRDVAGTLARVAQVGYDEVEFAGYFGKTPRETRSLLQANNLTSPSTHVGTDVLGDRWARTLADSAEIGHKYVTIAWIPEENRNSIDALRRLAEQFNRAGEAARAAGLRLAYHNHDFELRPVEGKLPYDVLLANTDPALVDFEMDLYWMIKGGGDPLAYFASNSGRFSMVHVKGSHGPPEHRMADVGAGGIDFRPILAHSAQAGTRHFFVEHDQPAKPMESIANSYRFLSQLEF